MTFIYCPCTKDNKVEENRITGGKKKTKLSATQTCPAQRCLLVSVCVLNSLMSDSL